MWFRIYLDTNQLSFTIQLFHSLQLAYDKVHLLWLWINSWKKNNLTCRIIVQVCSLQMSWSSSKWPWHLQVTLKCVGLGYGTGELCKGKKNRQIDCRQLFLHIVAFWQVFIWCKIGLVSFEILTRHFTSTKSITDFWHTDTFWFNRFSLDTKWSQCIYVNCYNSS
mgnify:FL=1